MKLPPEVNLIAVSHYLVPSDDTEQLLAQLRHAVGLR